MKNGLNCHTAPRLLSRLEWWNQINRYLDHLTDTPESISSVTTAINSLLKYYRRHRFEVQEDLIRALYERALQDWTLSHLYLKLFERMRNDRRTQHPIRRLFQLIVEEFNRPLPEINGDDRSKAKKQKLNNIKLMAAAFKRQLSGVPDDWISDCSVTLVKRLEAGLEESTQQLVLFLTSLLISEPGDECRQLLPSQQRRLLICFRALKEVALTPKITAPPTSETETESEMESDNDSETEESDTKMCEECQSKKYIETKV
jgi:hypothetical protein